MQMSMPPKVSTGLGYGGGHLILETDIADNRECASACSIDLGGSRVHRAGKLWVGVTRLCGDGDVGTIAGSAKCDRKADATAAAGDEKRLSAEGLPCLHFLMCRWQRWWRHISLTASRSRSQRMKRTGAVRSAQSCNPT